MRATLLLSMVVFSLHLAASSAPAQAYLAPPRAPDMMHPGYYYYAPNGLVYGPNYNVTPCFPPFGGMLPGPQKCQGGACNQPGGFPSHLFSRSPRDFFMVETDPRSSPFGFGGFGSMGRPGE